MAKRTFLIIVFLSFTAFLGASGERSGVINTYTAEIGVREASGNNDGLEVERYLASTGLGKGYAWCAAFVNWVYQQNHIKGPASAAWSPSWFPDEKTLAVELGLRGDVFGIYFRSKGRIAHVGFLDEDYHNGKHTILTVEGNTNEAGGREGDGVYRKRRSKNQISKVSCWL